MIVVSGNISRMYGSKECGGRSTTVNMKMVGEKQFRQNYILPSNHSHYTGVEETMKEFKKSIV